VERPFLPLSLQQRQHHGFADFVWPISSGRFRLADFAWPISPARFACPDCPRTHHTVMTAQETAA